MKPTSETVTATRQHLEGLARSAESVTLNLLDAVDGTVDAMEGLADMVSGLSRVIHTVAERLESFEPEEGQYIDEDDVAIDATQKAAAQIKDLLTHLVLKRSAINKDTRLKEHHCEALHDAFERAIDATAALADDLDHIRRIIISHDLKAEPRATAEVHETVAELIASLRS